MTALRRRALLRRTLLGAVLAVHLPGTALPYGAGGLFRLETPRSQALGGAGVALEHDVNLVFLNPAAVGRAAAPMICAAGQSGWLKGASGTLLATRPLGRGAGMAGGSYFDAGRTTLHALDGSSRQVNAGRDLLVLAGFAGSLTPRLTMGFTAQYYRTELVEESVSSAVLGDAGVQIRLSRFVKGGASVRRVGTGAKFLSDAIPAPVLARAGVACVLPLGEWFGGVLHAQDVLIAVGDVELAVEDRRTAFRLGVESWWHRLIALRVGGRLTDSEALGNLAAGLGVRAAWAVGPVREWRLDYSVRLRNAEFATPHNLSLTAVF